MSNTTTTPITSLPTSALDNASLLFKLAGNLYTDFPIKVRLVSVPDETGEGIIDSDHDLALEIDAIEYGCKSKHLLFANATGFYIESDEEQEDAGRHIDGEPTL